MAMNPFPAPTHQTLREAIRPERPSLPENGRVSTFDLEAESRSLIELLHEQTRCHRRAGRRRSRIIGRFLWDPATILAATRLREPEPDEVIVRLPEPEPVTTDFAEVLATRVSAPRGSLTGPVGLSGLAALLHMAVRVNRTPKASAAPGATYRMRPYPSPGALYPGEIYVVASNVAGLRAGAYRYDAWRHCLIDSADHGAGFSAVETAEEYLPPACVLAVASVIDRATSKYGARGYRLALLEAGHICQNLTLCANALSINSLVYGSFYDAEFEQLLGIDGLNEIVLSSVLLGTAP